MRLHHPLQPQCPLQHALRIFVVIVVSVNNLAMAQASNVTVQQAGQVHDVNIVRIIIHRFRIRTSMRYSN